MEAASYGLLTRSGRRPIEANPRPFDSTGRHNSPLASQPLRQHRTSQLPPNLETLSLPPFCSSAAASRADRDCPPGDLAHPLLLKTQHLDYGRLADHLVERALIDAVTIQHVVQQCGSTGALMPEILVRDNLISDWEITRVCAELFGLPFLPVETYPPSEEAMEGIDPHYLRQYGLVPLDRFGNLLTVAMPGLVPSEVLNGLRGAGETVVLPVVGSVQGNRNWLETHLPANTKAEADQVLESFGQALPEDDSWANLFDEAEEAVQHDLRDSAGE